MFLRSYLVCSLGLFALSSCTSSSRTPNDPIIVDIVTPEPEPKSEPTVTFEFEWIRDWDSPYFINGSDIITLKFADCPRYGISDDFFVWCLMHVPKNSMVTVRIPKPIRL